VSGLTCVFSDACSGDQRSNAPTEACAAEELEEFFVGVELAVFAGVMERDVTVGAAFALIDFATVKRLGVDVHAYRALIEFRQIQDLMDGLERIDVHGMRAVHFVDFGGDDFAGTAGRVFFFDAKILDFQPADRSGHPAVLIAMIVNAAVLADFPANGHALEKIVFENQIAGVISFGEEEIFFECFGSDGVVNNVVLNIFERKTALGNSGEALDPVGDGKLLGGELF
jgi:hypothetical protein